MLVIYKQSVVLELNDCEKELIAKDSKEKEKQNQSKLHKIL